MPTVSDLLVEAKPAVEQLREEPTTLVPEPSIIVLSASKTIGHLADMGREDNQLVPPHEIVGSVVPLVVATVNKPVSEEPIQRQLTSDELVYNEHIQEGITQEVPPSAE